MTEDEINAAHKERWAAAIAEYGGTFAVPRDVVAEMGERHRQDWIKFVEDRKRGEGVVLPMVRHDKTAKLSQFLDLAPPGMEVNIAFLAGAADCSESTAQKFVNDHRSSFAAIPGKRGAYVIVDTEAIRAADKSPRSDASVPAGAPQSGGAV